MAMYASSENWAPVKICVRVWMGMLLYSSCRCLMVHWEELTTHPFPAKSTPPSLPKPQRGPNCQTAGKQCARPLVLLVSNP